MVCLHVGGGFTLFVWLLQAQREVCAAFQLLLSKCFWFEGDLCE